MNELNKKLLAECFDALYSDNDLAKAERLFRRQWNLAAKENFKLLESEDEDFEITNMGDDFNQSIADEAGSDEEQKFEQLQIAVDELEDKYPAEMSEEVQEKLDELRNKIDEIKLGEESDEDVAVIIEDLKADFEVAGEVTEDIEVLFDEISSGLQGDESYEEVDVEDEETDSEEDSEETDEDDLEEAVETDVEKSDDDEEIDLDIDFDESEDTDNKSTNETSEENDAEDVEGEKEDVELVYDAKEKAEELLATLEELEASESEEVEDLEAEEKEEDGLKEGWEKTKLPRNKLQNEEEGVKKDCMKFPKSKLSQTSKGMGVSKTNSTGISANKKAKVCKIEDNGTKNWTKVAKPENTSKSSKSVLGK